jgi:hypothetical protein
MSCRQGAVAKIASTRFDAALVVGTVDLPHAH